MSLLFLQSNAADWRNQTTFGIPQDSVMAPSLCSLQYDGILDAEDGATALTASRNGWITKEEEGPKTPAPAWKKTWCNRRNP